MTEFDAFRKASEEVREEPPHSAWKRVESRLEVHKTRRSLLHSRVLGYAAAVILLVMGSATVLYLAMQPRFQGSSTYSQSIVDLTIDSPDEESIYDPEKIQDLSRRMNQYH